MGTTSSAGSGSPSTRWPTSSRPGWPSSTRSARACVGLVVGLGGEVVQSGTLSDRGETFELPLTAGRQSFGTLTLSGRGFTAEQRGTAASLVAHAAIALENARLHRIVARQALVDM